MTRGRVGVFALMVLVACVLYIADSSSQPSSESQSATAASPGAIITAPAPTAPTSAQNGSCQAAYVACAKAMQDATRGAAAIVAVAQVCETNWKACVTKKCVTEAPSSLVKECVKDTDCATSCTEVSSGELGLISCCLGEPEHNNACPKKVDGKCLAANASASAPPASTCDEINDPLGAGCIQKTSIYGTTEQAPALPTNNSPVNGGSTVTGAYTPGQSAEVPAGPSVGAGSSVPGGAVAGAGTGSANAGIGTIANGNGGAGTLTNPQGPAAPVFQQNPNLSQGIQSSPVTGSLALGTPAPVPPTAPVPTMPATFSGANNFGYTKSSGGVVQSPITAFTSKVNPNALLSGISGFLGGLFGSLGASSPQATVQISTVQNSGVSSAVPVSVGTQANTPSTLILVVPASGGNSIATIVEQQNLQKILNMAKAVSPPSSAQSSITISSVSATPTSLANPSSISGASDILSAYTIGTASYEVSASDETVTSAPVLNAALDLRWATPTAVVVGIPVDINGAPPASTVFDQFNAGWVASPQRTLEEESTLAQVQSDYDATEAQISAWQQLQNVGLCGSDCLTSLASLESQTWQQRSQIDMLTRAIQNGGAPTPPGAPVPGFPVSGQSAQRGVAATTSTQVSPVPGYASVSSEPTEGSLSGPATKGFQTDVSQDILSSADASSSENILTLLMKNVFVNITSLTDKVREWLGLSPVNLSPVDNGGIRG